MNNEQELIQYRRAMYRLLSNIYINEVDEEMLQILIGAEFPEIEDGIGWQQNLKAGFEMLQGVLAGFEGKTQAETAEMLEDLAADYAKTFLAAGDAAGKAAFPYESVYTGADSQFGGSVQMQLNALFAANGLAMSKEMFPIIEDHIGLEMAFMAEILDKHDEAKAFFKEHLEKWAVRFANDIYKYSERDFYKGIARITIGFIDAETEYFKG